MARIYKQQRATHLSFPILRYETSRGQMYQGTVESVLDSDIGRRLRGKVQLIFTSPPYPLNRKKKYGNLKGDLYIRWLGRTRTTSLSAAKARRVVGHGIG